MRWTSAGTAAAPAIASSTMRKASLVPFPIIGLADMAAMTSWAISSSIARMSPRSPSAVSVLRTLSGALVPCSSTPMSRIGVSRVAGSASCLSSGKAAAAG